MANNILQHFTLYHVAAELQATIQQWYCTACFTQEKNTLHYVFEPEGGGTERVLECNLNSRHGAIFLKSHFHRARKNTLNCFPEIIGRVVREVALLPNERILRLTLPPFTLYCIVFAGWNAFSSSSSANTLLTDTQDTIVGAFRTPQHLVGMPLVLRPPGVRGLADFPPEVPILQALAQSDFMLGRQYAREALQRLGVDESTPIGSSDIHTILEDIMLVAQDIRHECLATRTFFLLGASGQSPHSTHKPFLSLIHLTGSTIQKQYSSISAAIQDYIAISAREERFFSLQSSLIEQLETMLEKARRAYEFIQNDMHGDVRAKERRLWAELLMAQPEVNERGRENLSVQDWEGVWHHIPLQPALSLRENAEHFFDKASHAKEALKKRELRQRRYMKEIQRVERLLGEARHATTISECEQMIKALEHHASSPKQEQHRKNMRFREFPLETGYTLYVGKTAADNDELTLRFAKPNDYWFHARGVPGSHAILRSSTPNQKPPKHILEQAASIAAYFSKARNATMTPVAYTQKKYVRKPKGAAVGAVLLEREEVIMARPHVPERLLKTSADDNE